MCHPDHRGVRFVGASHFDGYSSQKSDNNEQSRGKRSKLVECVFQEIIKAQHIQNSLIS